MKEIHTQCRLSTYGKCEPSARTSPHGSHRWPTWPRRSSESKLRGALVSVLLARQQDELTVLDVGPLADCVGADHLPRSGLVTPAIFTVAAAPDVVLDDVVEAIAGDVAYVDCLAADPKERKTEISAGFQ